MPNIILSRKKDGSLVLQMDDKLFHFRTQEAFNKFASKVVDAWIDDEGNTPFINLEETKMMLKPADNLMLMALIACQVLHPETVDSGLTPNLHVEEDGSGEFLKQVWQEFY